MREERAGKLVWDDQHKRGENWYSAQQLAWKRIRNLLRTQKDDDVNLKGYDLGKVRTLRDFEKYAGFHFQRRAVQKYTLDNNFPPNPPCKTDEEWEKSFCESYYHLIHFDKTRFKLNDYLYFVIAFDDKDGKAIHREDLNEQQVKEILERKDQWVSLERFFLTDQKPYKWVVWGYSKSKGWDERIEHIIPETK